MKIAIDVSPVSADRFLMHRVRGVGSYIDNLKTALEQYNQENTYIFFTRGKKLPKDVDLVHYPYFEPFFLTLPLVKTFPTVVTVHDLTPLVFPEHFPPGLRGSVKWLVQKFSVQQAAKIISDSACSKRDIIRYAHVADSKIHVVHLAASDVFKPIKNKQLLVSIREKYKLPEKFVLYVGDVTWNKNVPRLIEAIKKINLILVIVGKALTVKDFDRQNPWNKDITLVEKLVEGDTRVIRLGFVDTNDLAAIYNLATVFAMPSLYEGFGLPVLEAMACGVPVVTTKCGSIPEVAEECAYYVDPNDIDSIAKGIEEVFSNSRLRETLSHTGIVQAKKFSWKKTAQQTADVYKSLV